MLAQPAATGRGGRKSASGAFPVPPSRARVAASLQPATATFSRCLKQTPHAKVCPWASPTWPHAARPGQCATPAVQHPGTTQHPLAAHATQHAQPGPPAAAQQPPRHMRCAHVHHQPWHMPRLNAEQGGKAMRVPLTSNMHQPPHAPHGANSRPDGPSRCPGALAADRGDDPTAQPTPWLCMLSVGSGARGLMRGPCARGCAPHQHTPMARQHACRLRGQWCTPAAACRQAR